MPSSCKCFSSNNIFNFKFFYGIVFRIEVTIICALNIMQKDTFSKLLQDVFDKDNKIHTF